MLDPTTFTLDSILRRSLLPAGVSLLAVLGSSCGPNHPTGAGSETIPPSSSPTYTAANASLEVSPGAQAGYGIRSLGPSANTYRILWTGDGNSGGGYHEFWGSMWTTGTFTNEVPGCTAGFCALESGDYVSTPYSVGSGQRIDWDTFADDGLDGFEVTSSTEPVYVDCFIDGQRIPTLTFFPDATNAATITTVSGIPFGMSTQ